MQLARRNDNNWPVELVAQLTGGRAKDRVLEIRAGRLQDGHRAVRVVAGPVAGKPTQGKTSEVNGADRILGTASRELPHLARSADEHIEHAVDVDDLD